VLLIGSKLKAGKDGVQGFRLKMEAENFIEAENLLEASRIITLPH